MGDLFSQIREEMRKVYLKDEKPIVVAFSGGKDSSLLLTLLWEMLESLPLEQRTKTIHIMTSDTGVELPEMSDNIYRTLTKIERNAQKLKLPIQTHLVKPSQQQNFWYKLLGRGTLISTPNTRHRWCTHSLKIAPTMKKLRELISSSPVVFSEGEDYVLTLWLGVRNEESARRKANIERFQLSKESLFARHSDLDEVLCFHPIKFVSSDELWFYLLDKEHLPFGVDVEELTLQYGENILECGMKTSSEQGNACGGSGNRQGCFVCGMVSGQDPMLLRHIQEGKTKYQYLLDWKNLMLSMRNDIRFREVLPRRQFLQKIQSADNQQQINLFELDEKMNAENRYETFRRARYDEYYPGSLTIEGRKILLEALLYVQCQTGYKLITEEEIDLVLNAWYETDGIVIKRRELVPRWYEYDGPLVFSPNKTVNKSKTLTLYPVFFKTIDLNMDEDQLYQFLKERQKLTMKSYFFFPDTVEFKDKKLVWNKVTFVICQKGVTTEIEAAEILYQWLGWQYGHFTKETKKAAIHYLMLSAIREGLKKRRVSVTEYLPLVEEFGQIAFNL